MKVSLCEMNYHEDLLVSQSFIRDTIIRSTKGVIFAFYSNLLSFDFTDVSINEFSSLVDEFLSPLSFSLSKKKKHNLANSFQRNSLIFARTQVSNFWNIYKATLEFYKTQTRQGTWKAQNYGGFFPPQRGGIERRGSVATGSRNFSWLAWFIACKSVNKSKPCVVGLACVVVHRGGARN